MANPDYSYQNAEYEGHLYPDLLVRYGALDWLEYFSLLSTERGEDYKQHYAGPGVHYLITDDLEIGTRVFWGMSDDAAEFICNAGLGVRF